MEEVSMNEREKMIAGMKYNPADPKLVLDRDKAGRILTRYNKSCFHEFFMKNRKLSHLLNTQGRFWIKPPFYCDYGYNIDIGDNVMLNYGCVLLDVCKISIGEGTLIGPNTQIYTACHAIDPKERAEGLEFGKAVNIGKNVWVGGGTVILPGVSIGDNSVIGAGSVVTKPIPNNVIAFGNPCTIQKTI